jgi:glucokinase
MLLAGDIGGTKTLLGLFRTDRERPTPVASREYVTLSYSSLGEMVGEFLDVEGPDRVDAAAFGVAGVVRDETARLTNVPWVVDAAQIVKEFGIRSVSLLNDLQAMAYAVPVLDADELAMLQEGLAQPDGNAALIAAGTGLGEALLHNVDGRFIPSPSEGGHADFAARTPREIELLQELIRMYGRAEYEHVVSGIGLVNLFRFTHRGPCPAVREPLDAAAIPPALSASAMAGQCPSCVEALNLFIAAYGAEAGNLGLRSVATAGVYLGGGIAPKILPALETGAFIDAFRDKAPMTDLLATMPVYVILNPHAGLLGAAVVANDGLQA